MLCTDAGCAIEGGSVFFQELIPLLTVGFSECLLFEILPRTPFHTECPQHP